MKIRDILPILLAGQAVTVLMMIVVVIVQVSLSRAIWRVERDLRAHARVHRPVHSEPTARLDGANAPTRRIR